MIIVAQAKRAVDAGRCVWVVLRVAVPRVGDYEVVIGIAAAANLGDGPDQPLPARKQRPAVGASTLGIEDARQRTGRALVIERDANHAHFTLEPLRAQLLCGAHVALPLRTKAGGGQVLNRAVSVEPAGFQAAVLDGLFRTTTHLLGL
eukprot:scaffold15316_cov69-Phaeocystis_antarctica.AAC.9